MNYFTKICLCAALTLSLSSCTDPVRKEYYKKEVVSNIPEMRFKHKGDVQLTKNDMALKKISKDAMDGSLDAQFFLSRVYSEGKVEQKNMNLTEKWIKALADGDSEKFLEKFAYNESLDARETQEIALKYLYIQTQYNIGSMYLTGFKNVDCNLKSKKTHQKNKKRDLTKQYKEANFYLNRSAMNGYALSQYTLAYMNYYGVGTKQYYKESLFWDKKSDESFYRYNYRINGLLLDLYYSGGFGLEKNIKMAHKTFNKLIFRKLYRENNGLYNKITNLSEDKKDKMIAIIVNEIKSPLVDFHKENAYDYILMAYNQVK